MKSLSVLFFVFAVVNMNAQQKDAAERYFDNNCLHHHISVDLPKFKNLPVSSYSFAGFRVLDYRPDTSRIGLFMYQHKQADLRLYTSAAAMMEGYLNFTATNPTATGNLLVLLKECWVSDIPREKPTKEITVKLQSRLHFRAEAFLEENDVFIPFLYLDTVIMLPRQVLVIAARQIAAVLNAFAEKINTADVHAPALQRRRVFSLSQLDSMGKKDFSYPILTAEPLRKGVYATISEFRNNRPSIFNYHIEQDNQSMMTLRMLDEEGKSYFSRKIWGYCDGEQTYAMMDGNLFPILRYGRTHYVFGSKEYRVRTTIMPLFFIIPGAFILGTVPLSEKVTRNLRYFRLNIQTGEIL